VLLNFSGSLGLAIIMLLISGKSFLTSTGFLFQLCSLVLANTTANATGSGTGTGMVVQHVRQHVPSGFILKGPAPSNQSITIRMALASTDMEGLEQKVLKISHPANTEHGQWLSKDEVRTSFCILSYAAVISPTF
jgi:hypothetical protein